MSFFSELQDKLFGESTQDLAGRLSPMFQEASNEAMFNPYSVATRRGTAYQDPNTGALRTQIDPQIGRLEDIIGTSAGRMFGGLTDFNLPSRAQDIYNQQLSMLQPSFQQQNQNLQSTLFGSGRLGLGVGGEFVGAGQGTGMVNPDAYGLGLAQSRALTDLASGSRDRALGEAKSMADIGQGLFTSALSVGDMERELIKLMLTGGAYKSQANLGAGQLGLSPQIAELAQGRTAAQGTGGMLELAQGGIDLGEKGYNYLFPTPSQGAFI
tara:strand:+ start:5703 stop:6506 length:804 start_codon:yes stop_codon:yes gene_type:complete